MATVMTIYSFSSLLCLNWDAFFHTIYIKTLCLDVFSMEEVYLFYWLSWLLIIIVYFFMEKTWLSYYFLCILFIVIATINIEITILSHLSVNIAFTMTLFAAFLYYARFPLTTYHLLVTFMFVFAYVALLLWEKVTPVWFIIDPQLIIPFILTFLLIFVCKDAYLRVATALLGVMMGQLLFDLVVIRYGLSMQIGPLFSFNILYTLIIMLLVFHLLRESVQYYKRKILY